MNLFLKTYVLAVAIISSLCATAFAAPPANFVTAEGTRLKLNGQDFYFSGANSYSMLYSELEAEEQFLIASELGLNAIRTWGFWNGEDLNPQIENGRIVRPGTPETDVYGHYVLQSQPRVYPEQGWRRMDYVVYLANVYDVKLIIPLMNEWPEFGGLDTVLSWANDLPEEDGAEIRRLVANRKNMGNNEYENAVKQMRGLFWDSIDAQSIYFDFVEHMLNRVNTYTGVAYKDDPAIMIWEIMNEPRFGPWGKDNSGGKVRTFLEKASQLIKSIDPNHLVGTGEEGFFRQTDIDRPLTTYPWKAGSGEGVSWIDNSRIETIDVLSFHCWPYQWNLWGQSNTDGGDFDTVGEYPDLRTFGPDWLQEHINAINDPELGIQKPLYLGEFGFQILRQEEVDGVDGSTVKYRNEIIQPILKKALESEDIAGVAYWSMTASHDVDYAVYKGPIERNNLLQAYFNDDAVPHDLAFNFDIFCPEDKSTCAMIEEFTTAKLANNVNNAPYLEPCLAPKTQCGVPGDMNTCVIVDSHPDHCGMCNNPCEATQTCSSGECVSTTDLQMADDEANPDCRFTATSPATGLLSLLF